jgi:hypothetical protein
VTEIPGAEMRRTGLAALWCSVLAVAGATASPALADPLRCDFSGYRTTSGLNAAVADDTLTLAWDGARPGEQVRLSLAVEAGAPVIRELAVRPAQGGWSPVARNVAPEFRVVSAMRRITNQQLNPLRSLGVPITQEVIDTAKWEAFWDAPLRIGEDSLKDSHLGTMPPKEGILNQPGLPRRPEEVRRVSADWKISGCTVKTDGGRIEVAFPGVELGVFSGRLQYTVYRGTNLIRQEVVAKTEERSVAYKYDAGLKGLPIAADSKVVWRDITGAWQGYAFGGALHTDVVPVQSKNRLLAAESAAGSLAFFPPPHNFFWAREVSTNLGNSWYRKDSATSYSAGVRQAEAEAHQGQTGRGTDDWRENFALVSARPGTWQRMAVYILPEAAPGASSVDAALAFTRNDRYAALPGHKVMLAHVHAYFVRRLREMNATVDTKPLDFDAARAAGVNIFAPIDGGAEAEEGTPTPEQYLANLATMYEIAKRHSDRDFSVMINLELTEGEVPDLVTAMGGHWDLQMPRPLFYTQGRKADQPLIEIHPKYGQVYRLGSAEDVGEMMRREGVIAFMPHPRSKGSTGYPDALKDTPRFQAESFRGIGYRWGMGLDGSEKRLCDIRCLTTLDDMNNWVADLPVPPKYAQAISEFYQQGPGDDIYANTPVNYLKLDALPGPGDWKPIVEALRKGEYFVTSGEVLIPHWELTGEGRRRTLVADVQWTFPLEFVEVVWGDGKKTDRQIIPATELPAFGAKRFEIPFDTRGKKWVRFAAWDSAGNGAFVQPVKLGGR